MSHRAAIAAACIALSIGLFVWLDRLGSSPSRSTVVGHSTDDAIQDQSADPRGESAYARDEPLPVSLEGTDIDGALIVDDHGHFVATRDAIDLFDYFLSARGEESDERIHARIVANIETRLDEPATREARALLERYLDYRDRAAQLVTGLRIGEDTGRRLQYIRELRREVFGTDLASRLFGEEESQWFLDLERQRILADGDLDPEERARELAAIEDHEPPAIRAAREAARAHRSLRDQEAALREAGAGTAAIDQLREARFGVNGAMRLAELDASRADWAARLDAYRTERDALLATLPDEDRALLVESIRRTHFDESEQRRVRALDRVERMQSAVESEDEGPVD